MPSSKAQDFLYYYMTSVFMDYFTSVFYIFTTTAGIVKNETNYKKTIIPQLSLTA